MSCTCRLCSYDREFDAVIGNVPEEHRPFFVELKERWETTDFDAQFFRSGMEPPDFIKCRFAESGQ